LLKELSFTGEFFNHESAKEIGIVSKNFETKGEMVNALFETAEKIASKSPVAIVGIKKTIDQYKREAIRQGLEYVKNLNMSLIFTNDSRDALMASLAKQKAIFPKL
jgi:enoyl-CoA hydratase/carnithine racemase